MKKEPWLLKNIFWILSFVSASLCCIAAYKHNLPALIAFFIVFVLNIMLAVYYATMIREQKQDRDAYEKAHYYQARKKTIKILKGGKS